MQRNTVTQIVLMRLHMPAHQYHASMCNGVMLLRCKKGTRSVQLAVHRWQVMSYLYDYCLLNETARLRTVADWHGYSG